MTCHIRPLADADIAELETMVALLAAYHEDMFSGSQAALRRDCMGPNPWLRVLIAEADRELAGYAAMLPTAQMQFGRRGLDIHHLFVKPGFRQSGIGLALIQATREMALELAVEVLVVSTHPDNNAAQKAYKAMGFEQMPNAANRFRMLV